ncbi:MAG: class I SAM-dependent methyltransferase [Phycisphaerae bacterium]|nr:class I SAM-dependent methyltransferase [Phycisphaerae bacterium]
MSPARALDLGCGEGVLLNTFPPDTRVVGVDISGESLQRCRKLHPRQSVLQADASQRLPFPDQAFDLVVCTEVLEHVTHPANVVSEMWRVCGPNGRVILTVPIERPKLLVKRALGRLGLMSRIFPGIESGFSAWHLQDFDLPSLRRLLRGRFEIQSRRTVWGLHRCLLLKPYHTTQAVGRLCSSPQMSRIPASVGAIG